MSVQPPNPFRVGSVPVWGKRLRFALRLVGVGVLFWMVVEAVPQELFPADRVLVLLDGVESSTVSSFSAESNANDKMEAPPQPLSSSAPASDLGGSPSAQGAPALPIAQEPKVELKLRGTDSARVSHPVEGLPIKEGSHTADLETVSVGHSPTLVFLVNPGSAEVYLNGSFIGDADKFKKRGYVGRPGLCRIRIVKAGYVPYTKDVNLSKNQEYLIEATMELLDAEAPKLDAEAPKLDKSTRPMGEKFLDARSTIGHIRGGRISIKYFKARELDAQLLEKRLRDLGGLVESERVSRLRGGFRTQSIYYDSRQVEAAEAVAYVAKDIEALRLRLTKRRDSIVVWLQ